MAWARFTLGTLIVLPFALAPGLGRTLADWRAILRGVLIFATVAAILTALKTEPIANVYGAFFVGPILSYFLSSRLLKEPIGRLQTLLLLAGFGGVLMIARPGFGMTPGLGFAVLSGVFYGCYLTASRWIGGIAPARQLLFVQILTAAILFSPWAALPPAAPAALGLLALSGAASTMGNLLLILAYRWQRASVLAPFVYFQLVAATAYGLVVFGDSPEVWTGLGLVVLIASGFGGLALRRPIPAR